MLDAAAYPLKSGVRVDKNGRPITLRLWAPNDSPALQTEGKLITYWWKQIGINVQLGDSRPGHD